MPAFTPLECVELCHAVQASDRFLVAGADAADFLHRIAASEVRGLVARHLVLTDDKASLVDAPLAVPHADGYRLIAGPGRGVDLRAWLEKWIIVDDVSIEPDPEPSWRLGEPELAQGDVITPATKAGPPILVGGPAPECTNLADWEAANFRAGRLYPGPATASGPNPLDLGWKDLIAFDKGCYIGQEVIARMDTYDKVRRGLATASLVSALPAGTALSFEGRRCGSVLSSVELEEGVFAWVVVDRTLAADSILQADSKTAGSLLRAPAV